MVRLSEDDEQTDDQGAGKIRHDQRIQIKIILHIQKSKIAFELDSGHQKNQAKYIDNDIDDILFLFHVNHPSFDELDTGAVTTKIHKITLILILGYNYT